MQPTRIRDKFTVAAVQAAPVFLEKEATVDKAYRIIEEAASQGARLIVFPEVWIPGYPLWIVSYVWGWMPPEEETEEWLKMRKAQSQYYARLWENSVDIPGPETKILAAVAQKAGAYVVMGVNEREAGNSTIYNTLLFMAPNGEIIGKHRKLVPTHVERVIWGKGDGSGLKVFPTELGKLGGLICAEHFVTPFKHALLAQGEDIHISVWPSWRVPQDQNNLICRAYALEGGIPVVMSCGFLTPENVPEDFPFRKKSNFHFAGGSCIINPLGKVIAGPLYDEEGIVYGEIDPQLTEFRRETIDIMGHYGRPDVVSLMINQKEYKNIQAQIQSEGTPAMLGRLKQKVQELGDSDKSREAEDLLQRLEVLLAP